MVLIAQSVSAQDEEFIGVNELNKSVVFLINPTGNYGTGNLITDNQGGLFLVTAGHVAKYMDQRSKVIVNQGKGQTKEFYLFELGTQKGWIFHDTADVAVMRLSIGKSLIESVFKDHFVPLSIVLLEKAVVPRDDQLIIIGFPNSYGVGPYFSPLTFRSYLSSDFISMPRFDNKTVQAFLLLENPSFGGYSGGPVYDLGYQTVSGVLIGGGQAPMLIGFIHGTIADGKGGSMAAITPAFYLRDLIK